MCAGGVGEVQVGVCTSVVGLGKGPGLYCRGTRAGGPSGGCLLGTTGHNKLPTTLGERLGRSCPIYQV